jgi:prophage tail gpP-like protein
MEIYINDRIRTRTVKFFENFNINLKYDSLASDFTFRYFFDPNNIEHKEFSCIGHYHIVTLKHNGETILTGQILSTAFNHSSKKELAAIGGYSLPGVLEDCEISPPKVDPSAPIVSPYQFDLLTFRQIVAQLISPYGLSMVVDPIVRSRMDEQFEESNAQVSQNIKSFICELAAQKNIVVSHNQYGQLVFTQLSTAQKPIATFDGSIPVTSMSLAFNGQRMHSHIKVIGQSDLDDINATENEIRNPYVINSVYRPRVIVQSSKNTTLDVVQAAKNIRAQELKGLSLVIKLDRWTLNDKIIRPGQVISVINPEIYLYKKSNWVIEEVLLEGDASRYEATLHCVVPETYNGAEPQYLFKGINLH